MDEINEPTLFEKGQSQDHRGSVEFFNSLDLSEFKRFYIVSNQTKRTVRAWHGHKIESKLIKVIKGEFLVAAVKVNNFENPNNESEVETFLINEESGSIYIPPGYANGAINLVSNSKVIYFSSLKLEDSVNDDYRFNPKFWDIWSEYSPEIYE
jgi:dTDP-4-dehydrorhamnose 3,5-epimerase